MTKIRFTLTAAAILAALTLCSCTDQKTEYNYNLIGGELNSDNEYTVDIRKDASDDTSTTSSSGNTTDIITVDDTNSSGEQNPTTSDAPSAPTSEPTADTSSSDTDVTTPSVQPAAPTQSSKPTETSEPASSADAATSETSKPSTSEKKDTTSNTAQKYDENGFPANPEPFQSFTDASGQRWEYDNFAGWCKAGGGGVEVTDFWTGEVL